MSLGRKTLYLQLIVSAGSILLSIAVLRAIVFPLFVDIDRDMADLNQQRVLEALSEHQKYMMALAGDYGGWDLTYDFVLSKAPAYIASNISVETVRKMGTNALVIMDKEGRIVSEMVISPYSDEPLGLRDITQNPDAVIAALNTSGDSEARKIGVFRTHLYPMAFASHPILPNASTGTPRGSFLIGSFITEDYIAEMGKRLSVNVSAVSNGSADWPGLRTIDDTADAIPDGEHILNRRFLYDILGAPALLLEIRTPRAISLAGRHVVVLAILFLSISSLALLLMSHLSLKRMIVGPLGGLTDYIEKLRAGSKMPGHLDESRGDELGILAQQFNALIRELGETQHEMADARDDALQAAQAKAQFLANMSHEIRTPMNGVVGMTDLLLSSDSLGGNERRFAETVRTSAASLLCIINDVLDFSKMEAGKMQLDSEEFDLRQCVEEVIELLANGADKKGLQLIGDIAPELPRALLGDVSRLRQVLINLVGNAIKFTDKGGVTVSVSVDSSGSDASAVRFSVKDTGIGVSDADKATIYESFAQADGSVDRRFGGTGLGLAISRHIVELMGGSIELESELDVGSTFSFVVELAHADGHRADKVSNLSGERSSLNGDDNEAGKPERQSVNAHVLLVEDNLVNQQVAYEMLRNLGCTSDIASDGIEAIDLFKSNNYDIVLMDCQMPRLDGFGATRKIREWESNRATNPTLIVAVTANALKGDRERCVDAGMDDYLTKPFTLADLHKMLVEKLPLRVLQSATTETLTQIAQSSAR